MTLRWKETKKKDGFAHQDGKRPRKEALFGGARLTLETGSDFPIGVMPHRAMGQAHRLTAQVRSHFTGRRFPRELISGSVAEWGPSPSVTRVRYKPWCVHSDPKEPYDNSEFRRCV